MQKKTKNLENDTKNDWKLIKTMMILFQIHILHYVMCVFYIQICCVFWRWLILLLSSDFLFFVLFDLLLDLMNKRILISSQTQLAIMLRDSPSL